MYNITLEDYDTLFQLQGGVCAIQKEPLVKLSELYKTITITNSYKDWDKEELPNNIKVIKVYE